MEPSTIVVLVMVCAASLSVIAAAVAAYFFFTRPEEEDDSPSAPLTPEERAAAETRVDDLTVQCQDPRLYTTREQKGSSWECPKAFEHDTGINWSAGDSYYTSRDPTYNAKQCTSNPNCVEFVKIFATDNPPAKTDEKAPDPKVKRPSFGELQSYAKTLDQCSRTRFEGPQCEGVKDLPEKMKDFCYFDPKEPGYGYGYAETCLANYFYPRKRPDPSGTTMSDVLYLSRRVEMCEQNEWKIKGFDCQEPYLKELAKDCGGDLRWKRDAELCMAKKLGVFHPGEAEGLCDFSMCGVPGAD